MTAIGTSLTALPILTLVWSLALPAVAEPTVRADLSAATGAELYRAACAACHGADGRGAPAHQVAFEEALPDLSDCGFATREPDADWLAVSHQGGPARAFSRMMPAFGEALTEDQLLRALSHVRTFCGDRRWPRGELNLPLALFTEKAYPEDEVVWRTGVAAEDVSIGTDWRSSIMAHAARDPYWQASVRRETLDHLEAAAAIEHECAACHMPMARFELPEQVLYLEWRHSAYAGERSCQSCHMPVVSGKVAVSSVLGVEREEVSRHVFRGGNAFMLRMLNRYRADLRVVALPQELDTTARRTRQNLETAAAR